MPPCHRLSDIIYGGFGLDFGRLDTRYCALTMPVEVITSDNFHYQTLFRGQNLVTIHVIGHIIQK